MDTYFVTVFVSIDLIFLQTEIYTSCYVIPTLTFCIYMSECFTFVFKREFICLPVTFFLENIFILFFYIIYILYYIFIT